MDGGEKAPQGDDEARDPLEDMLASILGPDAAAQALSAMRAQGIDPHAMSGLPTDPAQFQAMIGQVQQMMSAGGDGPVNWQLAEDVARRTAVQGGDHPVSAAQASAVRDALRVADLWLDAATDLTPTSLEGQAWTRAEWVKHTLPTWRTLAEPIATSVVDAMIHATEGQMENLPPEMRGMLGGDALQGMMRQMGGAMFGMQLGQAVGTLASETFGSTDIGLPLHEQPVYALLPHSIDTFAEGLPDIPRDEVRQFLAVREAARARLFGAVPWLRAHLLGAVDAYAREIHIDLGAVEEAMRDIDPARAHEMPEMLREKFSHGGLFGQEPSAAQTAALARLETMLALVEGWVEEVSARAVAAHLPHQMPLREMLRRRRATDGPAEQTFRTLVGLELRPKRVREAATLWAALTDERGEVERDALWAHPDLMPTSEDLDDPAGFGSPRGQDEGGEEDFDAALAAMLDGTLPRSEGALEHDAEVSAGADADSAAGAEGDSSADDADGPETPPTEDGSTGPVDGRSD